MKINQRRTVMAEINMVPFIDITLILLIIFMVLTPFLVQMQMNVDLPKSASVNTVIEDNVLRVEIQKSGQILIDSAPVPAAKLEEELLLRLGKAGQKTILVTADKDVSVQIVVDVFDIAKKLGAAKLGIAVLEK